MVEVKLSITTESRYQNPCGFSRYDKIPGLIDWVKYRKGWWKLGLWRIVSMGPSSKIAAAVTENSSDVHLYVGFSTKSCQPYARISNPLLIFHEIFLTMQTTATSLFWAIQRLWSYTNIAGLDISNDCRLQGTVEQKNHSRLPMGSSWYQAH